MERLQTLSLDLALDHAIDMLRAIEKGGTFSAVEWYEHLAALEATAAKHRPIGE